MDVIIVSKTHMSNAACVGGVLANGRFVRLLNSDGYNQDSDTDIEVGEVYTISFSERTEKRPPHIEDILVHSMTYKFTCSSIGKMVEYLKEKLKIKIWTGSSDVLFDGNLQWTSGGSGYISENGGIPNCSVGFWIPDKDLTRKDFNDRVRYSYPLRWRNISYVGFQNPVDLIPEGTLVRVSLARWWSPNDVEERCYLQLSGWYDLPESKPLNVVEDDDFDKNPKRPRETKPFSAAELRKLTIDELKDLLCISIDYEHFGITISANCESCRLECFVDPAMLQDNLPVRVQLDALVLDIKALIYQEIASRYLNFNLL